MKIKKPLLPFLVLICVTMILGAKDPVNSLSITPLESFIPSKSSIDSTCLITTEEGLVGYWNFDEGSGNTAYDSSENNNNGTIYGANWTTGISGAALEFDGVDDYIIIPNTDILLQLPLTITAYVKPFLRTYNSRVSIDYPNNVISNDNYAGGGQGFGVNVFPSRSTLTIMYQPANARCFKVYPDINIKENNWYFVAIVFETGSLKSYINGALIDNYRFNQGTVEGVNHVLIGKHNDDEGYSTRRYFKGIIDEIKIYEQALNTTEITSQSSSFANDSDGDGMSDGWETLYNLNPFFNEANEDPDNDSLSNLDEYLERTNPHNSDSDADGMPDGWEVSHSFNPLTWNSIDDPDYDKLYNIYEYLHCTDPWNPDSDNDGLLDGDEVKIYNSNPLAIDSDADGLSDYNEVKKHKTDPNNADSDNDFFPDGVDRGWWGNPRTIWDNPLTRVVLLLIIFVLLALGIWVGFVAYQFPRLQQDLKLLHQQFQQYAEQFKENINIIRNQESLEELETVADHIFVTFQSYKDFFLFAQQLVNRKWLPSFLRPDLLAWEAVFTNMKHTFEDFQQTRLKRLEAKY
ncbi:MAG: LamG-like jellyroll fold domain-containing protein [Candidatus Hodarchaeota archaeon]